MQNLRVRLPAMAAEEVGYLRDKTAKLSVADVKGRQSSKIREIGEALITAGFVAEVDRGYMIHDFSITQDFVVLVIMRHRPMRQADIEQSGQSPAVWGANASRSTPVGRQR